MKLAVLIPHRDRDEFKDFLACYLPHFLTERGLDFKVIFCEQMDREMFSRSITVNMAFHFAMQDFQPDYVVVGDVDMAPVRNVDYEWKGENNVWFVNAGGLKCRSSDFMEANGYNVTIRGWGYEDSELWKRLEIYGKKISRWSPPEDCVIVDMEMSENANSEATSMSYWGSNNPRFLKSSEFEPTTGMTKPAKTWYSETRKTHNSSMVNSILSMPTDEMRLYFMKNGLYQTDYSKCMVLCNSPTVAEIGYDSSDCIK